MPSTVLLDRLAVRPWLAHAAATAFVLYFASTIATAEVLVFTDRTRVIQPVADARVITLDLPRQIEAELAAQLSTDPEQAAATVRQRLHAGGPALQRRLRDAYQGVVDAWSLGIAKLPAVVVDRRYVVYGEPDVALAIARIQAYRSERP